MTPEFGRKMASLSDEVFRIEHGLTSLLETVVRMHLVTFVSLIDRSVEDIRKISEDQAEQFNFVLTHIKNLLDRCRELHSDIGDAEMSVITPMVTLEQRLVQAQQRLEEELERHRKKDNE